MTVAGQTERLDVKPTEDITTRLDNLAQSLAGEYPPHTLMDLAEAASLISTLRAAEVGRAEALKLANDTLLSACIHLEEWPSDDDESQRTKAARIAAAADAAATVVRAAIGEHP